MEIFFFITTILVGSLGYMLDRKFKDDDEFKVEIKKDMKEMRADLKKDIHDFRVATFGQLAKPFIVDEEIIKVAKEAKKKSENNEKILTLVKNKEKTRLEEIEEIKEGLKEVRIELQENINSNQEVAELITAYKNAKK